MTENLSETRLEQADLVKRIRQGDEGALEAFYDEFFPRLYRYAFYRVNRDHHHTEEVVHDTFVEALEKIDSYEPERGSLESWLITLSRNRIRSSNTTVGRAREFERSWSMLDGELDSMFADLDRGNLPEAALESEEMRALVGTTMESIPESYSKLLEMKYVMNLSVRDMAEILHKTEKAVESQLTRARMAFREAFKVIAVDMPV